MRSCVRYGCALPALISLLFAGCGNLPPFQDGTVTQQPGFGTETTETSAITTESNPACSAGKSASETPKEQPVTGGRKATSRGDVSARIKRMLPPATHEPDGWSRDIATAFKFLQIDPSNENICAVLAVIEQESSFVADPPVANLSGIVRAEIDERSTRYHIPEFIVRLALSAKSPDGRTYDTRLRTLKTENDLNRLYADMTSELPLGKRLLEDYNPVKTGGPMQVSLDFAQSQIQQTPYPYVPFHDLRSEVFSRRGGLYFGIAYLLNYPTSYSRMIYRFADYNAGRYASRNTAFQSAVSQLSGETLTLDGDLLRYSNNPIVNLPSQTQKAVLALGEALDMTEFEIAHDLAQEKSHDFENTPLYRRIFAMTHQKGLTMPREQLPEIKLNSPKITSGLTTSRFAGRVDERYQSCLKRI